MSKFIINENTWRCGHNGPFRKGYGITELLNNEGYMCCLGQIELQLGLKPEDIKNVTTPGDLDVENILSERKTINHITDSKLSALAMGMNDNDEITHDKRKKDLTNLFNNYGHELEFINGSATNTENLTGE